MPYKGDKTKGGLYKTYNKMLREEMRRRKKEKNRAKE